MMSRSAARACLAVAALVGGGLLSPSVGLHAQSPLDDLRARAEQGEADAQFDLGVAYAAGDGVPEDEAEALRWYRLAADQGHAAAQTRVGTMYANGRGVPRD